MGSYRSTLKNISGRTAHLIECFELRSFIAANFSFSRVAIWFLNLSQNLQIRSCLPVLNNSEEVLWSSRYGSRHDLGKKSAYGIRCWNPGFIYAVVVEFLGKWGRNVVCFVLVFDFSLKSRRFFVCRRTTTCTVRIYCSFIFKHGNRLSVTFFFVFHQNSQVY